MNKDFSFDTIKKELNDIVCILIYVTDKFKSCIGVKFFEQLRSKNGKRIIFLNDGLSAFVYFYSIPYLNLKIDFKPIIKIIRKMSPCCSN